MTGEMAAKRPKLLAVASGGGHWIQLLRLRQAFSGFDTAYVTMFENYAEQLGGAPLHIVPDASRFELKSFPSIFWRAVKILIKERPTAIVTTGAAPGLCFIILGRLTGCRTLWVDSIANSERLSSSGRIALKVAHKVVSQWPEVARKEGVDYWGAVI